MFVQENAFESVVCEMAAILSSGRDELRLAEGPLGDT